MQAACQREGFPPDHSARTAGILRLDNVARLFSNCDLQRPRSSGSLRSASIVATPGSVDDQDSAQALARRVPDPGGVGSLAADGPRALARHGVGPRLDAVGESSLDCALAAHLAGHHGAGRRGCAGGAGGDLDTRTDGPFGCAGTTPRGTRRRRIRSPGRSSAATKSWSSPCRRPAFRRWPAPTATRNARTSSGW